MSKWTKWLVIYVALLSYALFFLYFYHNFDPNQYTKQDYHGMLWFFILLLLVVSFPINIKGTNIVFAQAITVALFLQFGFIVEAVLMQLAVLNVLIRIKAKTWDRYVVNGTMFLFISAGSAYVYHALGGHTALNETGLPSVPVWPIMGYMLTNIAINHILLYFIQSKIRRMNKAWFGKDFWWEVLPVAIITPTGILIYLLYSQLHIMAIVYVMIPVVTFSIIFRLYNKLDIVNEKLKAINHTGNAMTGKLDMDEVISEFMHAVEKLVPFQYAYIFKVNDDQNHLEPIFIAGDDISSRERERFRRYGVDIGDGLSGIVAEKGESIRIGHEKDDIHFKNEPDFLHHQNSILSVPLISEGQISGVMTLSHKEENRYAPEDVTLVEILANQAAIALKNVEQFAESKRKSERDELTGLYNYRYFEQQLFEYVEQARKHRDQLALILLDIDHFKQLNDQYGHLAGNKILKALGSQLLMETKKEEIVARYGGEEFTILLPRTKIQEAMARAESIRQRIETMSIEVNADLQSGQTVGVKTEVRLTVSLGIAVFPNHAEDTLSLVRHADRALYTGAKQRGRNRVAVYQTG
ncbi:sensor domain-containing diguanylate cyclase [Caldalkalibacillus salinus]|uniref:sensor domain-containing diguanylate cyclase n=1 Tax=Caldalkalibacillus salinus TaxID=2803787 RepID=UPI001923EAB7|nr:sensor domain-containing diguanylate cyclase [Caldalkalibacillus salinus]